MISVVGFTITLVMVFGGYLLAGGKLDIILKSLPFEMMMIGGAAVGAFVLGGSIHSIKVTLQDTAKVFKGPSWSKADYNSLLLMMYQLVVLAKKNPVELERNIDNPADSEIFQESKKISSNHAVTDMICDTLRTLSLNYDDSNQVEDLLDQKLDQQKHHHDISVHGLQSVADGLPALGIVAAVLGVIKTMGSIDQPPEVLGKLIGGALVGTFLGVFLAYCLVAPFAAKVKACAEDDLHFFKVIKNVLVAHLQNHPPKTCIEVARQAIPHDARPSFQSLEEDLKLAK